MDWQARIWRESMREKFEGMLLALTRVTRDLPTQHIEIYGVKWSLSLPRNSAVHSNIVNLPQPC